MKNKIVESGVKENLNRGQQRGTETEWVDTEVNGEETDIAMAIAEAHDDPC